MLVQIDSEELNKLIRDKSEAKDELREIKKNLNQIYGPTFCVNYNSEFVETISKVEQALGFKLYFWQKTYINIGKFRRYGYTTAKILKELLDTDAVAIDYRRPANSFSDRIYREELIEVKKKLDVAGVKTRDVLLGELYCKNVSVKLEKPEKNCGSDDFIKILDQELRNVFPNCSIICWLDNAYQLVNVEIKGFIDNKMCGLMNRYDYQLFQDNFNYIVTALKHEWECGRN